MSLHIKPAQYTRVAREVPITLGSRVLMALYVCGDHTDEMAYKQAVTHLETCRGLGTMQARYDLARARKGWKEAHP